ncbi:hypothetical protein ASG12_06490 [Williamsia sp. Leaf354]|nr:hypothetical protein ASG12_06490 [Williamsia sp. Leaf354]
MEEVEESARWLSHKLDRLKQGKSIDAAADVARISVMYRLCVDPRAGHETTLSAARMTTELHTVQFAAANQARSTRVRAVVGGDEYAVAGTEGTHGLNLANWFEICWWKALSRSEVAAAAAGRFELTELTADGRWGEHRLHLFRALQSRDVGDPQWTTHLADAARSLEQPISVFPEEADLLDRGVIEILVAVAEGDQRLLTDRIGSALSNHRVYWTKSAERREDCRGFSSLPIAAAAALAVDEGMTVEVESDYLAMGLVRPGWFHST